MLISDFDMIDKYLIDADMLLRNIADIKEIESDVSYLTPEQVQLLRSFWIVWNWICPYNLFAIKDIGIYIANFTR